METAREARLLADRVMRVAKTYGRGKSKPVRGDRPLRTFGIRLGILRQSRGLNIDQLAKAAHVNPDLLFAVEMGAAPVDQVSASLLALSGALGVSYLWLSGELFSQVFPD